MKYATISIKTVLSACQPKYLATLLIIFTAMRMSNIIRLPKRHIALHPLSHTVLTALLNASSTSWVWIGWVVAETSSLGCSGVSVCWSFYFFSGVTSTSFLLKLEVSVYSGLTSGFNVIAAAGVASSGVSDFFSLVSIGLGVAAFLGDLLLTGLSFLLFAVTAGMLSGIY